MPQTPEFSWLSDLKRDWDDDDQAPPDAEVPVAQSWRVHICIGKSCQRHGGSSLARLLRDRVHDQGLDDRVEVELVGCRDRCDDSPSMNIYPGPTFYNWLTPNAIESIVNEHLAAGKSVDQFVNRRAERNARFAQRSERRRR